MGLQARTISGVVKRDWLVSPWLLVAIAGWLVLTALGTMLAIPVFANVASPGLQCFPASACPTVYTTEWIPSVLSAAVLAAGVIGVVAGSILVIRHRAG
jgi:hypothetical protein